MLDRAAGGPVLGARREKSVPVVIEVDRSLVLPQHWYAVPIILRCVARISNRRRAAVHDGYSPFRSSLGPPERRTALYPVPPPSGGDLRRLRLEDWSLPLLVQSRGRTWQLLEVRPLQCVERMPCKVAPKINAIAESVPIAPPSVIVPRAVKQALLP